MTPYLLVPTTAVLIFVAAWLTGRIHIHFVNPAEPGSLLTPDRVTQRLYVYGTLLVPPYAVYASLADNTLLKMNETLRKWFFAFFMIAGMLAFVVITLSNMELSWNRSLPENAHSRKKWFNVLWLPILYGSLDLFWFAFGPAWYLLLVAIFES